MVDYIPMEKGTSIRNPSTANLLIDSIDRGKDGGSSANFIISLNNSIMNGFFTRLAVTEVVVDWCIDNISATTGNNALTVVVPGIGSQTVTIPDGQYNVQQCLDALIDALNSAVDLPNIVFSLGTQAGTGIKLLICKVNGTDKNFVVGKGNLQTELNISANNTGNYFPINCPKLLPYTYIDFVSNSLTYNQALKDATTNTYFQNVLYRWYFAWDGPVTNDSYGYPIYQGYNRFIARRALPFPKQIRWEPNQPIGQINFQVLSSEGTVLQYDQTGNGEFEWAMTILVSEV